MVLVTFKPAAPFMIPSLGFALLWYKDDFCEGKESIKTAWPR